jgi:hypothetical protein
VGITEDIPTTTLLFPDSPSTVTSGSRHESIIAVCAIAACLLLDLAQLHFGIDVVDEGYFGEQASRVLRGEVPYRDFESLYTPGLTYLHAAAFALLGGPYLIGLRIVALAGRGALAFALYALARSLSPPRWAIVPPLFILLGLDFAPVFWWPHPGWLSEAASVFAVVLFGSAPTRSRASRMRCLFLAGALTAVVFVLKQNAGVFLGMSMILCVILSGTDTPPQPASRGLRVMQVLLLLIVTLALYALMRPHLDTRLFVYLVAPVIAIGLLMIGGPMSRTGQPLRARARDLLPLGAGFVLVTAPWLAVLALHLNGQLGRLGGFVGAVEQSALFRPLQFPSISFAMVVLALAVLAVAAVRIGRPGAWTMFSVICAGLLLLLASFPLRGHPSTMTLVKQPWLVALGIPALLPTAAFWVGLLASAWAGARTAAAWRFRWYLAAGALTFLTEYPIVDVPHLAWSAGVLLVVGAILLGRIQAWLIRQWNLTPPREAALFAALLVVPVLAALPVLIGWRVGYFLEGDLVIGRPTVRRPLVPLENLTFAQGLWATRDARDELIAVVRAIDERTVPGEPIFVYPASPLLYVLAERPNPTRLAHIYPGTVSRPQVAELVRTLEETRVRTVVISSYSLLPAAASDNAAVINTYLKTYFREVWSFGSYRILDRIE